MAVAFRGTVATGSSQNSSVNMSLGTTQFALNVGDLVVVCWSADNLSATTPTVNAFTDISGNAYTNHVHRGQNATAAAGVVGGILACKLTNTINSGSSLGSMILSGAVTAKATVAFAFTGADNTLRSTAVVASGAGTAAASPASGTVNSGDLVIGMSGVESRSTTVTYDSDTTNGSWAGNTQCLSNTGGSDATCTETNAQYKIATASGAQTLNHTVTNTDWVAILAVFQATPLAAATGRPKVYSGASWSNKPLKVWSGSAWVEKPVKYWNGSAWVLAR